MSSQTVIPEEAASKSAKPPGASHTREVSNISDFAYRPGESGFTGDPADQEVDRPHSDQINALANVVSNASFESFQTTAVNSDRESSEASSNEARHQSPNHEDERLDMLRKIVEAAKPGDTVKINIKIARRPSGAGFEFEAYTQDSPSTWKHSFIKELRA